MAIYADGDDNGDLKACQADGTAAEAACVGIALNAASDGQPLSYLGKGSINLGATLTIGTIYIVSDDGAIAPSADAASSDFVTVLGIATTAALLDLDINASGIEVP
jgi:hypothetical protein